MTSRSAPRAARALALAAIALAAAACDDGATLAPEATPPSVASQGTTQPATPAATMRLELPDAPITVAVGRPTRVVARFLDAQGRPARGPGDRVTWRTSNAQVVAVGDTMTADSIAIAALRGVAPGTTTLHVSAGALLDSVTVRVVAADSLPRDTTPRPPATPVARFNLTVQVMMAAAPAPGDTVRAMPAPGARVSVVRLTRGAGDTLAAQTPVGNGVADAQGRFALRDLPSGVYRTVAEPPEGNTTLQRSEATLGAPTTVEARVLLYLDRKR
jgi:hypothetical protein